MKIVLYYTEQTSFVSKLVSFLTNSNITHASIINDGINYDTDLEKDEFSKSSVLKEYPNRFCIVYDIPDKDCQEWINKKLGTPYDLLGYILWIFGRNPSNKMHCFDTVVEVLKFIGVEVPSALSNKPTGDKLMAFLASLNYPHTVMQCHEVS